MSVISNLAPVYIINPKSGNRPRWGCLSASTQNFRLVINTNPVILLSAMEISLLHPDSGLRICLAVLMASHGLIMI
jgi:hypothetical protein